MLESIKLSSAPESTNARRGMDSRDHSRVQWSLWGDVDWRERVWLTRTYLLTGEPSLLAAGGTCWCNVPLVHSKDIARTFTDFGVRQV